MGGALSRSDHESGSVLGLALTGAFGFGAGLLFGIVAGELLGDVDQDRVKRAVRRFRSPDTDDDESAEGDVRLEYDLLEVLKGNPATRQLDLNVSALGGGLVELTGTAPNETTRELAADLARGVLGTEVVVNRILVDGTDTNGQSAVVS